MTMTAYIKNDLRARIQAGDGLLESLTLCGLATHYKVSLTPVRCAVNDLIQEKWILKRPNGRLVVNGSRSRAGQSIVRAQRPEPRRDWYRVIADDVIRLSFRGQAVFLREEAAARKYGISRTVVRQVFNRLAGLGIFEHLPRRGWRVRPFRCQDVASFLQVREAMELLALELARPRLVRADLEEMLDNLAVPRSVDCLDDAMHRYLVEKSENRYIQDFFREHTGLYNYRILFGLEHDEVERNATVAQHRNVIEALLAEDWARARKQLSQHIWHQLVAFEKAVAALGQRGGEIGHKGNPGARKADRPSNAAARRIKSLSRRVV